MGNTNVQFACMIGKEVTRGSAVTCDKDIGVAIKDLAPAAERELVESQDIGTIEVVGNYSGMKSGGLKITGDYLHGRLFEFIVGEASHATTSSDTVHTFHPFDSLPKTFTAEAGANLTAGDVGGQYTLNTVESAELKMAVNELLGLSVTTKSKAPTTLTTVPAHVTSSLAAFPHALCEVTFNGVEATEVQDCTLSFTKEVVPVNGIGSDDHQDLIPASVRVKISGTLAFSDETYHNHFANNDVTAITFGADNGVALGSGKRAIAIALQDIEMNKFDTSVKIGNLTLVSFEAAARLNTFTTTDNISSASWY